MITVETIDRSMIGVSMMIAYIIFIWVLLYISGEVLPPEDDDG